MNSNYIDNDGCLIFPLSSSTFLKVTLSDINLRGLLITETHQSFKEFTVDVILPLDFNLLRSKKSLSSILQILIHNFHPIYYKASFLLSPLLRGGGGFPSKASRIKKTFLQNDSKTKIDAHISDAKTNIDDKRDYMRDIYFFENDQYPKLGNNEVKIGPFYEELLTATFEEVNNKERFDLSTKNFRKFMMTELKNQERKKLEARFCK